MKKAILIASGVASIGFVAGWMQYTRGSYLSVWDVATFFSKGRRVGHISGDPLARLHLVAADLRAPSEQVAIRYIGASRYLNNTRAVVTHTIDDSTRFIPGCIDTLDKYGVKATVFISTGVKQASILWPRLEQAVKNGHEIGSHSRRHQCQWPDTFPFCFRAYTDYEIVGSRDDILQHTAQPYVWSWCYPCGNCNASEFVHRKLSRAGYIVARNYPDEAHDRHNLPNLQTYDTNPYNATYTQLLQRRGGIAKTGRTNVTEVNAKFDEVYENGGIYNFMSHPQWLDYGPTGFYEQHLAHIAQRSDIWYVPMGPLYAYHTVRESTKVSALDPLSSKARFAVYNDLDARVFLNSITLEFAAPQFTQILSDGHAIPEGGPSLTDRWSEEYFRREGENVYLTIHPNTIVEFQ